MLISENREIRLKEAIADFGPPDYSYTTRHDLGDPGRVYYWFRFNLAIGVMNYFHELRVIKRYNWFGKKELYIDSIKCPVNVQAKWEMSQVDGILLESNNE